MLENVKDKRLTEEELSQVVGGEGTSAVQYFAHGHAVTSDGTVYEKESPAFSTYSEASSYMYHELNRWRSDELSMERYKVVYYLATVTDSNGAELNREEYNLKR